MSKFNYSKQFSKKNEKPVEVKDTVIENPVEVEEVKSVNPPQMPTRTGIVSGCAKLNVRKGPSKDDEVVAVIDKDQEIEVITEVAGWYNVRIAGGIFGYCMTKFITIK